MNIQTKNSFQFLIGRVKMERLKKAKKKFKVFQFLIGRVKIALGEWYRFREVLVSIPYR